MVVNELKLPESFVELMKAYPAGYNSTKPKDLVDAYGHELDTYFSFWAEGYEEGTAAYKEIAESHGVGITPEDIEELKAYLAANAPPWVFYVELDEFPKLVFFGADWNVNPIAFDFREDPEVPSAKGQKLVGRRSGVEELYDVPLRSLPLS